ncbi:hypothetical protein D3C87_1406690 [compost metagenome]
MHEGRARQVQAHDFHQELVAVGRAVEGAGAGAVVGGAFGLQQGVAADLTGGVELAHARLFLVREAGRHRAGRHEDDGQVPELQRPHQQARHDLVAHAEHQRRIEGVVRERDHRTHGNGVAREQRQLHAGIALRDAVAHRRHAAGHLGHATHRARRLANHVRIPLVGLVGRQHVVVRGNDAEIRRVLDAQLELVVSRQRGVTVRQIRARHAAQRAEFPLRALAARQIGGAARAAALDNALRNGRHLGMNGLGHGGHVPRGERRAKNAR